MLERESVSIITGLLTSSEIQLTSLSTESQNIKVELDILRVLLANSSSGLNAIANQAFT